MKTFPVKLLSLNIDMFPVKNYDYYDNKDHRERLVIRKFFAGCVRSPFMIKTNLYRENRKSERNHCNGLKVFLAFN